MVKTPKKEGEKKDLIEKVDWNSPEDREIFWHSAAHVLAIAATNIFPDVKLTIGPSIENGFYYDFYKEKPFVPEDLKKLEHEMKKIVAKNLPFVRREVSKEEALNLFKDNKFKLEMVEEFGKDLSVYSTGDFVDLCRGPHVKSTGMIKAFKLTKVSGSYWRADAKNEQLQRVYGVAYPEKQQLDDYLRLIEEAEKRDHKKLGKQLDLFSFHEEGPGFPFILPKGMVLWDLLMDFWKEEHRKAGYMQVKTPIILSRKLWEQSGHWDHYKENMYFTKIDNQDYAVKPMNCPGSLLIYKEKIHSYKEFPLRTAEVGLVHRHELSGVLNGMFRVRSFHQDDAHIFMTEEQIKDEIIGVARLVDRFYKVFGLTYHIELSTMPDKHIGDEKVWKKAEKALADAMKEMNSEFKINPGEGAFYGPKLDFHIRDALGRTWQCATIQLDFAMPEKFDLTYEGGDGKKHRPVMIHRVVYGAIERFIGIITEHYAGKFPLWLAPVQVKVITVADRFSKYAKTIKEEIEQHGLRVELDIRQESVGYKVREAQMQKIPIIINVGEKEEENRTVAVRTLDGKVSFGVKVDVLVEKILHNLKNRELKFEL